ncbi:hypothetical protein CDD82_389 [Ophiocordyceps australis]|uniref:Uncharacterized protein n=1 Tax=Ophiocordyceps australis TaxID=1399860 RepID=A0A2C5YU00_9HYPO|nr:hypothetical protein CDD82_389 [Ophiocordyceps australis]
MVPREMRGGESTKDKVPTVCRVRVKVPDAARRQVEGAARAGSGGGRAGGRLEQDPAQDPEEQDPEQDPEEQHPEQDPEEQDPEQDADEVE